MCGGRTPLFSIEETTPNYDGGGYGGFMSDEDEEDEKEEDLHFI